MSANILCNLTTESDSSIIKTEENLNHNPDVSLLCHQSSSSDDNVLKIENVVEKMIIPEDNVNRKRLSTDTETTTESDIKLQKCQNKYLNGNSNGTNEDPSNNNDNNNSVKTNADSNNNKHKLSSAVFNHDSESKRIHMDSKINQEQLGSKDYLYKYMYVEKYENGGGYILHAYQDELAQLEPADLDLFVNRFFKCLFRETQHNNNNPYSLYCIGIIHGSVRKFPELLSYLADKHDSMIVKTNLMEFKNDMQTITIGEYAKNVYKNYKNGLFRYGPLHSVSLVGTKGEETGGYFKDVIKYLEKNPFLKQVMPWGPLSKLAGMTPSMSNDGPILWIRHGEQAVPSNTNKKKRKSSPTANTNNATPIMNLPTTVRGGVIRQTVVNDRTHCHADHADDGLDRHTTAAVGVLKAVHPPNTKLKNGNYRVVKDVVCFDPRHYTDLIKRLKLDIMEPPASQCGNYWADDAELNQLRIEGYRFIRIWLRDNDVYFIPRNVVHQFKTVSSVSSIAWHVRLRRYYHIPSAAPAGKAAAAASASASALAATATVTSTAAAATAATAPEETSASQSISNASNSSSTANC